MPRRASLARALIVVCFALVSLLTVPRQAGAVEYGGVRGLVTDPSGAPLAGATVVLSRPGQGTEHGGGVTDAKGTFRVPGVPSGAGYTLQVSFPSYATVVLSDVEVQPGIATTLTVSLAAERSLRETVQVRAAPPVVALSETTVQTRFSSEFIDSLPILGRNYQDVLTLAPGVSDVDGDGNPNIHGARDTDVVTLVDGVSTTDPYTGKVGAQLNIESIQEIEVKTSAASAEFGRAQGGMVNIITKSGGNQFEGAFKFYWRGSAIDGDGAGIDDPMLHAGVGEQGLRDLEFNDYLPFVSLGGPIVKDRAWFFATLEYIQHEDPVNAVNAAFVAGVKEYRAFAKATWQATANTRLAFSVNYDPQEYLNQGLNSLTREETGFTLEEGGTNLTLRSVSVLSPSVVLEGTLGYLDTTPALIPNLGYDTNGNGTLFTDRNADGFMQANERDAGGDFDDDGAFDVWEDTHRRNGKIDQWEAPYPPGTLGITRMYTEDVDGDGHLTVRNGCEGPTREDFDCDGRLDAVDEDLDQNGRLDTGEDLDGDRYLDRGVEDRNGDLKLNDAPFPTDVYPYGNLRPQPPDRDYFINEETGITQGPYFEELEDKRQRASVRADLSVFVPDFKGNHDFRFGGLYERESFDRTTDRHDITALQPAVDPVCDEETGECAGGRPEALVIILPTDRSVEGAASGSTGAFYVQDTWRPIPNLSLGLGLRYEHETARAPGYTDFDPREQRDIFDALVVLSGGEKGKDDLRTGNRDGLDNYGISGDPLLFGSEGGGSSFGNDLINALRLQAIRHLSRHRSNLEYTLDALNGLYDLGAGGTVDPDRLSELGVTVQQPEQIGITNDNLSPRLAVSWDPSGDSRTKLFGTWGRYYDKLFLSTLVGEQGPDTVYRYYAYDADGIDVFGASTTTTLPTVVQNHNVGRLFTKSPPSIRQVDRHLATPYCDEWTLGFEREIAPEVALAFRYIHRDFRDQLQDNDINHEVVIDPVTQEPHDLFGIQYQTSGRLGTQNNQQKDGRPDLYIQNPFFNQVLRVENSNTARYGAFEVELRRRMSRRWEMQGSYVYSRAQGNAEDFQSKVGNDPSVTESEYGYLSFDQRHVVKLNASIFLPKDFQLGLVTSWSSGLPYSIISRFFAADNTGYAQFRTLFGFSELNAAGTDLEFNSLPRNSERNASVLDINTSVRKSFVLGRTTGAVSLEVMNLLNSDDLRVYTYEPVTGSGYDIDGRNALTALQLDATRRFGRRFQIGFQFNF